MSEETRIALLRHELRTPLTVLDGNRYVLTRIIHGLPEKLQETVAPHLEELERRSKELLIAHERLLGQDPAAPLAAEFKRKIEALNKENGSNRAKKRRKESLMRKFEGLISQARLNTAPASPSDGISPHELYSLQGKLFNHAEGLAYHLDQLEQKLGGHATDVMPSALSEMRDAAKEIDRIVKASVQGGQSVFDARELLAELQTAVFPGHRSFRIQTHSPSEPVTIHAERELLKSALLNLISNSIAHRDQRRELKVRVRLLTERGNALFEVHDTGKGIPAKRIPTLFSDFSSGRKPEERLQDSVHGTGLRIVHHAFTVAHPGELEVKSIIGSGTTFTGRIPLHD